MSTSICGNGLSLAEKSIAPEYVLDEGVSNRSCELVDSSSRRPSADHSSGLPETGHVPLTYDHNSNVCPAGRQIAESAHETLKPVLLACRRRIRSWRVPPRWSPADWFEEIEQIEAIAAWQAECDYDRFGGIAFAAFVYQRVMARSLTRYRQEWNYALHCVSETECEGDEDGCEHLQAFGRVPAHSENQAACLALRDALAALSEPHRQVIHLLFWGDSSEVGVAQLLNINQSTVNRRKAVALRELADLLRGTEDQSKKSRPRA
jgi:RNA polymerase sigma factor (sigma-70 family)